MFGSPVHSPTSHILFVLLHRFVLSTFNVTYDASPFPIVHATVYSKLSVSQSCEQVQSLNFYRLDLINAAYCDLWVFLIDVLLTLLATSMLLDAPVMSLC